MEIKAHIQGCYPYKHFTLTLAAENEAHRLQFAIGEIDQLEDMAATKIAAISNRMLHDLEEFLNPIMARAAQHLCDTKGESDVICNNKTDPFSVQISRIISPTTFGLTFRVMLSDIENHEVITAEMMVSYSSIAQAKDALVIYSEALLNVRHDLYLDYTRGIKEKALKSVKDAKILCLKFIEDNAKRQEIYWETEAEAEDSRACMPDFNTPIFDSEYLSHVFGRLIE
jgi:hypothetical protein